MKLSSASDSLKGILSSERITRLLEATTKQTLPGCETIGVSMADGGEGVIDAVISALSGTYRRLIVHGPLMEEAQSFHGEFEGDSTIIEMAAASGPPMVPTDRCNLLNTAAYGTGELIEGALDREYQKISIAIGGGATNDEGMGAARALGVRFLDDQGNELEGRGQDLIRVADIDVSRTHPAVSQSWFTVMCDVANSLTGPNGATYILGKQKGGTPEILDVLEGGMIRYTALLGKKLDVDVDKIPGAGAAGGLGAVFRVFLKANSKPGIDTVLDLVRSDSLLEGVDLVTTGEGGVDWQSVFGKVPGGIRERCRERGIPMTAIVGGMGDKAEAIFDYGINSIIITINGVIDIEEVPKRAGELYISTAGHTFRTPRAGISLGRKWAGKKSEDDVKLAEAGMALCCRPGWIHYHVGSFQAASLYY